MALERDYLIAVMTAKRWLEQLGVDVLSHDEIEDLARAMLDAVDEARERRQRDQ